MLRKNRDELGQPSSKFIINFLCLSEFHSLKYSKNCEDFLRQQGASWREISFFLYLEMWFNNNFSGDKESGNAQGKSSGKSR